ncbi:nitrate regulatory gene2 protein-like [Heracleum sosnowskyi]|uniref:Nitrate regulatory gene2 protein-like n=1 Tax=Heracleum sosnowskyi TaxID=360622 RepID=A0AAD8INV5_9APIA|nr:nitrate regulatory gene2 protein-like [Heracleum sosnowskyi]
MGCVASKLEEEEVVSICRERKRQLKLAVDRRYALADAHFRYCQALFGVSAAINLFVARHSSPGSSFLITFPPPSPPEENNVVSNPLFIQQSTSTEPTQTAIDCEACESTTTSDFSEEERVEQACLYQNAMREQQQACMYQKVEREEQPCMYQKQEENVCGYFYMGMPPSMPSPQRDFGWDFFDPFAGMRPEVISGYSRNSDDDLRVVREEEGIPELEEEEEEEQVVDRFDEKSNVVVNENKINVKQEKVEVEEIVKAVDLDSNMTQPGDQQKGLTVIDTPVRGRELLEALKDIEDHFLRAYESGKEVSKMLEVNRVHLQSNLEEIKEKSAKLIQDITLRSSSSRSSSCKSLAVSNSKNSSPWTEFKNDLFDDYGGMDSGSHSLTLGRLYAWEKKLYEEVKDGDSIRKIYEKKCNQLRDQDARGNEGQTVDKTRAAVKDLYSRILVAIRSAESISSRIEKLRDEELQPQIIELLQGIMNTWKIMMECHEIQNKIMSEVKTFTCPSYGKFSNNTHLLATLQLRAELQNWHTCFKEYMLAQKAYIEALHGWLSKFVVAEVEFYSNRRGSSPPSGTNGPQLLLICNDWLTLLQKLPDKMVSYAIKSFAKDVKALCNQQEEEQQQKRKVDSLSKVLDKKILTLQKTENKIFRPKHFDHNPELDTDSQIEYLRDRKDLLDDFKVKVEIEKEKHQNSMQETQRITLNGFQTGFCRVFESLTDFSKASLKMYQDLISYKERAQNVESPFIETSHVEDGSR